MSNQLFKGVINIDELKKVLQEAPKAVWKSKNGTTYVNVNIWMNETEDKFGKIGSIQLETAKGENKVYLGNFAKPKNATDKQLHSNGKADEIPW